MNEDNNPAHRAAHGASIAQEKLARADRIDYYSALFAPKPLRPALIALYALWHEVSEVVDECSDVVVAHTKLAWWQEEIQRLLAATPRHPITTALAAAMNARQQRLPAAPLSEIIQGIGARLDASPYETHDARHAHLRRTRGQLALLVAHVCDARAPEDALVDCGAYQELAQALHRLGANVMRGRIDLAQDDMNRFGVHVDEIYRRQEDQAFQRLMAFDVERTLDGLRQSENRLREARADIAPLYVGAALRRMLLEEIRNDGYRVLTRRPEPTPLRQWWNAWRAARRRAP